MNAIKLCEYQYFSSARLKEMQKGIFRRKKNAHEKKKIRTFHPQVEDEIVLVLQITPGPSLT